MPTLRVEYAASGRSKCSSSTCNKKIEKHELRIGTEVAFSQGGSGGEYNSWKWRHLCCFTERQLKNAKESGDLDNVLGFDDLAPSDKALVDRLRNGELVGDMTVMGRIGDFEHSALVAKLSSTEAKKKKPADEAAGAKRPRAPSSTARKTPASRAKQTNAAAEDDAMDSDATEDYEVEVTAVSAKPRCPFGENCFRTAPKHFAQYPHDDKEEEAVEGTATVLKPILKKKK